MSSRISPEPSSALTACIHLSSDELIALTTLKRQFLHFSVCFGGTVSLTFYSCVLILSLYLPAAEGPEATEFILEFIIIIALGDKLSFLFTLF